ncbi:hypothetical protein FVE67_01065 [Thermosulfurimonas marina]|uniref:Uncharacterized protein n=1 Tax=Thermosulfurimonas marina TaxID=2047767 RepID=A0A6H1WQG8_9BACT|nr:hypothetical protein [Thermosulfurimonas marina]QJA05465.1 hypothetical protein FVE67_01065 [Thermosulfurimonas marina]
MAIDHARINQLLQKLRSHPYCVYPVETPHTGYLQEILVAEDQEVRPGEGLFVLERERNPKTIRARVSGRVRHLREELRGRFLEAGEKVLEIWHPLSREEAVAEVLRETLSLVRAPETARYLLPPEMEARLRKEGRPLVRPGEELLIMTFMKRETPIRHEGPPMVIFKVFFSPHEVVPAGEPLLGLCAPEEVPYLERVIARIEEEWPES